jgi:hypothetical protein
VIAESIVAALRPHRKAWRKKLEDMGAEGRQALAAFRARMPKTKGRKE